MRILCIHPSRGRRRIAVRTAKNWMAKADGKIDYVMVLDMDDSTCISYEKHQCTTIIRGENKNAVQAINLGACKIKDWDLIVVVSDDFDCPQGWDTLLKEALVGKKDFIVKTWDGLQKTLITLPIMDRTYYDRFGYIYHPEYQHMHCDEEMTCVAHMLGKVINLDIKFPHLHYSLKEGGIPKDRISERNDKTWRHGQLTLNKRKAFNFGLDASQIVKSHRDIVWR